MKVIEKRTIEQEHVVDIVCNGCNNSTRKNFEFEHATLYVNFGYESKADGLNEVSHLCEDCYFRITQNFKTVPEEY